MMEDRCTLHEYGACTYKEKEVLVRTTRCSLRAGLIPTGWPVLRSKGLKRNPKKQTLSLPIGWLLLMAQPVDSITMVGLMGEIICFINLGSLPAHNVQTSCFSLCFMPGPRLTIVSKCCGGGRGGRGWWWGEDKMIWLPLV